MTRQNQEPLTPPGQMVAVGAIRLHARVDGQGTPTVVLEPSLGGFAMQYRLVQAGVAAFTRVLAYDRAGQGWSDPSPTPRTPVNLAGELHALLGGLALTPPYVLVGHSFGGLLVRCFAGFYPGEVAGVVLVDSSDIEQYDTFPDVDKLVSQAALGVRLLKGAARLGLAKTVAKLSMGSAAKELPKEDLNTFIAAASQPRHQETMLAEFSQHRCYFGAQSEAPRNLGEMRVSIVTAGNSVSGRGKFGGMTIDQLNEKHQQWQKDLLQLSTRSQQLVIAGATHLSLLTQPEHVAQVVEAIRGMVETVRGDRPHPTA